MACDGTEISGTGQAYLMLILAPFGFYVTGGIFSSVIFYDHESNIFSL